MRISIEKTMLGLLAASTVSSSAAHPSMEVLNKFSPHFRCPHANEWVSKGPKQAALDLGLLNATAASSRGSVRRRAQETTAGSCSYMNAWTNSPTCLEFRGDSWTEASMGERCAGESESTMTMAAPCDVPPGLGGYCVVGEGGSIEATPLVLADGMDCGMAQTTCENFMSGSFVPGDGCSEGGGPPPEVQGSEGSGSPWAVEAPSEPVSCAIAPGAIGAGHQAGYSTGYSPNCEGTPAEGSPYMWPMSWKARVESKSMAFGSDDVLYHSIGNVHYKLDKNWKRQDWFYQRGTQRSVGQAPCDPEDVVSNLSEGPVLACNRDSDEYQTMIHRGGKMMFISWKNGTEVGSSDPNQIESCDWLDLQVVGNIRPDWYMDSRGDSTGVQYLGDQHVFYEGVPRLVKQWRKKDFANQYFVMSVLGNVQKEGVHWPMILNVPGEGFGDDHLQIYTNQTLLTDDDDYLFLLDEALEGIGGACNKMSMGGGGGPPTGQTVHIPSNLEVDPNSWFENVYTYSPVWQKPEDEVQQSMATGSTGMATTSEGDVTVKSCYDASAQAVQMSVEYANVEMVDGELPWMALGYRETDECLMNPRGGGDAELILVTSTGLEGEVDAHFTLLPPMAKSFDTDAVASIYDNMTPLSEKEGFSHVDLHLPTAASAITKSAHDGEEGLVMLRFKQRMSEVPEAMHLMYAIGSTPAVGYHKSRKCFSVSEFPTCPSEESTSSSSASEKETVSSTTQSSAERSTMVVAMLSAFCVLFM